jgi:hypothetical protein
LRRLVIVLRQAKNNSAVYWQCLQHDVEAISVLVHERGADGEPKVVCALSLYDSIGTVGWLLVGHSWPPFFGY